MSGEMGCQNFLLQLLGLLLFICLQDSHCSLYIISPDSLEEKESTLSPEVSPSSESQPFLPLLAPSPLVPYTSYSVPKLSGLCAMNFSAAELVLNITAVDCWDPLALYLANAVCCPQFHATIQNLIGQSSLFSRKLSLNVTHASHCLSDIEQILMSQGANRNLQKICSIHPSDLTKASCPNNDVNEIEKILDFSRLSAACKDIDLVNECCNQVCQNAILDAAEKIAAENHDNVSLKRIDLLPGRSSIISDCRNIVLRWLASKLDPSSNAFLRGLSQCTINEVCPLVFPDIRNVTEECGNQKSNRTACCEAMKSYMSQMQEQSFITNLQATNCAAMLGKKLQTANIPRNVYNLCRIKLKDFSLQVGSQDSGCLFPSLPSDVKYDSNTGISFSCDLNDNVEASWPSTSSVPASLCNQTGKISTLPKATSAQYGIYVKDIKHLVPLIFSLLLVLELLV